MIAHNPHDPAPDPPALWAQIFGMAMAITIMLAGVFQCGQWLIAMVKWLTNGEC